MHREEFVLPLNVLAGLEPRKENIMTTQNEIDYLIDRKLLSVFQALRRMERKLEAVGDRGEVGGYEEWLDRVNRIVGQYRANGYAVSDEVPWKSFFQSGLSPDEAAQQALTQGYISLGESRRRRPRRESRYRRRRPARMVKPLNKYEESLLSQALVLTDMAAARETRKRIGLKSRRP